MKVGMVGNTSNSDTNVRTAQKCKVMFVHNVCNNTTDDDMKIYIEQNEVPVQNFEWVSNPASAAKSFKVKVLTDDVKKMLDASMWPSGIECNYWKFPVKFNWLIDNDKQLRIISYNSTGSNDGRLRYLNDASYGHDISTCT